jgi:hypothetical protein
LTSSHIPRVFGLLVAAIAACLPSRRQADWPVKGIRFEPDRTWTLTSSSTDSMAWRNPDGDDLTLLRVPAASPPLDDIAAVRAYGRTLADKENGGLVSADVVPLSSSRGLQIIYKMERRPAYAYTGLILVPAGPIHFSISLATVERGMTGERDAIVMGRLLEKGEISLPPPDPSIRGGRPLVGWLVDPYDPAYTGKVLRSRADEERYDALIPTHPLSKLRRWLPELRRSIVLGGT